jgi:hypothetical protein
MEGSESNGARGALDKEGFAIRRELRDALAQLIDKGWWRPGQFEEAVDQLGEHRRLAIRQMVSIFREGRVADEVAALEILGRLAEGDDVPLLSEIANDPEMPETLRVACGLVILGHDRADLIRCSDLSSLVLRWQARYVSEEPGLREPLRRLYGSAERDDRAKWVLLQDQELSEPEGRAAVFEMLLEVEEDADLRALLIESLARTQHPSARAALRRVTPLTDYESEGIEAALVDLARLSHGSETPEGWSARVGFADGAGSFALRFDHRAAGRRPKSAVFVLDMSSGVREALGLTGAEVGRYDRWPAGGTGEGADELEAVSIDGLMHEIPVPEALGLLEECEAVGRSGDRPLPGDYVSAHRLLDPLSDLEPRVPTPPEPGDAPTDEETARRLLEHPGYVGWFYDAGDHLLDDLRLQVLDQESLAEGPSETLVTKAATRLESTGEGVRLARRLQHNALVHEAGGEQEHARAASSMAHACRIGPLSELPLVRRMLRESLHPGHYFFAPIPDTTSREDLTLMLIHSARPTRKRVLGVDLAWILNRAGEVWLSRLPSAQRPHGDEMQRAVLAAAEVGSNWITRWMARQQADQELLDERAEATPIGFGSWRPSLRSHYRDVLRRSGLRSPQADVGLTRLTELLTWATETLVFRICMNCPMRCPAEPRRSGRPALQPGSFPAGDEAETVIRSWPGLFVEQPSAEQQNALAELVCGGSPLPDPCDENSDNCFECAVCAEYRPRTTLARARLQPLTGGALKAVCRRCQSRYRKDAAFKAEVIRSLGRLIL